MTQEKDGNETRVGAEVAIYSDPAAVAAAESVKARIQSAYIMAVNRPRNTEQARVRILEACKRPQFAERAEYKKPVGGRSIKGPSVRLAELCIREWGNIIIDTQVLYEDSKVRRIRITVTDLETNASFGKEIQVHKIVERKKSEGREVVSERTNTSGQKVFIVMATEDELLNKEAAMISKVVRNEGLRLIPSDIVDEAMEIAIATVAKRDSEDPAAAKKKVIDSFAAQGIQPKDLEKYLASPLAQITTADLQDLRAIYQSIRDGETTWREIMADKFDGEKVNAATPAPIDPDLVPENVSDVVIDDPTAEEPQDGRPQTTPPEDTPDGEKAQQAAAVGSQDPPEDLTLEGEPTEEEQVRVKIRELAEALDMKAKDVDRKLKAADEKGLQSLERLRQDMLKEYNATRTK